MEVTIGKTAASPDWRELRGAACVAPGPKPFRPPLQAAPSGEPACRAPPGPGGLYGHPSTQTRNSLSQAATQLLSFSSQ